MSIFDTPEYKERWANRAWLFKAMDFLDFEPRKGFKCAEYFK